MSNFDIDVRPNMFQSFLDVFDIVEENGDIVYAVDNYYGENIVPNDIYEIMVTSGWGIWGVAGNNPAIIDKIDLELLQENNRNYIVFNMCAFLGLPAENPILEMQELKELMLWLKQCSLDNPKYRIKLALSRSDIQTEIKIHSSSSVLETQLQDELMSRIESSSVLKKWAEIQKESFLHTEKDCSGLTASMDCDSLFNMQEKMQIADKQNPVKVPPPRKSFW